MSTLQDTTRHRERTGTRFEFDLIALGALGALIAVGAIVLVVALTGGHHTTTGNATAQARSHAPTGAARPAATADPRSDTTTHGLLRVRTTGRHAWPTLASVLAPLTRRERQYVLGILALYPAQLRAAFSTTLAPVADARSSPIHGTTAPISSAVALPIPPVCGPGRCWRGAARGVRHAIRSAWTNQAPGQ